LRASRLNPADEGRLRSRQSERKPIETQGASAEVACRADAGSGTSYCQIKGFAHGWSGQIAVLASVDPEGKTRASDLFKVCR
jgi:hypothetical protein